MKFSCKVGHKNGAVVGGDRVKKEIFFMKTTCLYADGNDLLAREIADRGIRKGDPWSHVLEAERDGIWMEGLNFDKSNGPLSMAREGKVEFLATDASRWIFVLVGTCENSNYSPFLQPSSLFPG